MIIDHAIIYLPCIGLSQRHRLFQREPPLACDGVHQSLHVRGVVAVDLALVRLGLFVVCEPRGQEEGRQRECTAAYLGDVPLLHVLDHGLGRERQVDFGGLLQLLQLLGVRTRRVATARAARVGERVVQCDGVAQREVLREGLGIPGARMRDRGDAS